MHQQYIGRQNIEHLHHSEYSRALVKKAFLPSYKRKEPRCQRVSEAWPEQVCLWFNKDLDEAVDVLYDEERSPLEQRINVFVELRAKTGIKNLLHFTHAVSGSPVGEAE